MKQRYAIVHLEFGARQRDLSLALLAKFRQALRAAGNEVSLLIVDNARLEGEERYSGHGFENVRVIAGDNSNREFTGWDLGVRDLRARGLPPDIWIFTNDTIATHHGWSDKRAGRFCHEAVWLSDHTGPWMLGEVTDCQTPGKTPIGPMLQWVATYCFAMNEMLLRRLVTLCPGGALLDSFVYDSWEPGHKLFKEETEHFFKGFLAWLVAEDPKAAAERARKFKWAFTWHNAKPLDAETFDSVRGKVRCVISETFLSVRATQAGAELRSPYDATLGRARLRRTAHYFLDKFSEKMILRRLRKAKAAQSG